MPLKQPSRYNNSSALSTIRLVLELDEPAGHDAPALELTNAEQREQYMQRIIDGVLRAIAGTINITARIAAPAREVDVFPHRLWASGRRWSYWDAYTSRAGHLCVEAGRWTIEASWNTTPRMQELAAEAAARRARWAADATR